jgi:hypothetical protein
VNLILSRNMKLAKRCLGLIRDIAARGSCSTNPDHVGYALQELSQVLLTRTGDVERLFEPSHPDELPGLDELLSDLELVATFSDTMSYVDRLEGIHLNN